MSTRRISAGGARRVVAGADSLRSDPRVHRLHAVRQHCPVGAIPATPYQQHVIDAAVCTRCDVCRTICPEQAIRVV